MVLSKLLRWPLFFIMRRSHLIICCSMSVPVCSGIGLLVHADVRACGCRGSCAPARLHLRRVVVSVIVRAFVMILHRCSRSTSSISPSLSTSIVWRMLAHARTLVRVSVLIESLHSLGSKRLSLIASPRIVIVCSFVHTRLPYIVVSTCHVRITDVQVNNHIVLDNYKMIER